MVKASILKDDGRHIFVLGLSDGNIKLLRQGKPIPVNLAELGGRGEVLIMWGQTEQHIVDELRAIERGPTS